MAPVDNSKTAVIENAIAAVSYTDPDAPGLFTQSLLQTGFGVLKNHPIEEPLVEKIYAEWLDFFNSPAKHAYGFDRETQDGFFSTEISEIAKGHDRRDLKEFFHIFAWGRYPAELSAATRSYFTQAGLLARELLSWVENNTPTEIRARFSMPLAQMIEDSPATLLRVLHYPPLTGDEPPGALRAAAHEDINLLTVLPAANERGLEILTRNRDWAPVPADFGTLVVNVGDMLQEASGGYYRSTTHRVVNPSGEAARRARVALPLFLQPRPEVVLSRRHTAGSYLAERLTELRGTSAQKTR